jgi:hypothetical protein
MPRIRQVTIHTKVSIWFTPDHNLEFVVPHEVKDAEALAYGAERVRFTDVEFKTYVVNLDAISYMEFFPFQASDGPREGDSPQGEIEYADL